MFSQVEHRSPRPISPKYIKRVLQRVAGERYSVSIFTFLNHNLSVCRIQSDLQFHRLLNELKSFSMDNKKMQMNYWE